MAAIRCDWCLGLMRRIGDVETGMLKGFASVWLCAWCSHEREIFDSALPLDYWRDGLMNVLYCRVFMLDLEDFERRFDELQRRFDFVWGQKHAGA